MQDKDPSRLGGVIDSSGSTTGLLEGQNLRVKEACTVICLRQAPALGPLLLTRQSVGISPASDELRVQRVFGACQEKSFERGWEVLMCQRQAVNWLRSTKEKLHMMRYPCEFNFAGGTVDNGESYVATALRELSEELQTSVPADTIIHLLNVQQTRPVGGTSNIMFNFVCLAEENPWLATLDVNAVNGALGSKEQNVQDEEKLEEFWALSSEEKEILSPEMHCVEWLSLRDAVFKAFTSMNEQVIFVNEHQRREFDRYGIRRRDPLYVTMSALVDVEDFSTPTAFGEHARKSGTIKAQKEIAQWLHDGATAEEVAAVHHRKETEREAARLDLPARRSAL
jgi:8-oxo-dGTP pyrophosphatase MutT (NUDIX family)